MLDEFGCRFLDAAFWVHEPEDKETSIAQQVELEKEKWLHEYSLNYPEYNLVFDRYIPASEPFRYEEKSIVGVILFRAYG